MKVYHDLLQDILINGEERDDRTGIGTRSVFGRQLRFDLRVGFPAITTKKLAWKAVVGELIWFLEGSRDERRLAEITHGTRDGVVTIWSPNAMAPYWRDKAKFEGDLGPVYGVQWRDWGGVDQIKELINGIKKDPWSRRHIVSAWNVSELDQMCLVPCHVMSQYYVSKNGELSCHMIQRSADMGLGIPFNIASYALLTHMIAQVCDLKVGELIISIGDAHIYKDHIEQIKVQLTREEFPLPRLYLNYDVKCIDDFKMNDIILDGYQHHPPIKMNMAV
jgi:thymidylate synthase